jgi:pilus assembly protein CpaE
MDQIIILGIILFVLFLAAAGVLVLIMRRRRAAAANKPQASKEKPKKSTPASSQPAPKSAVPNGKLSASPGSAAQSARPLPLGPQPDTSGKQIRILIVDDNVGTRENVSRLLYFEEDMQVIGQAVNGRQGVDMAIELKPHIVLMDINMPDMDGIAATQELSQRAPFSQVIIMSVQADQHYMKQAMAAGARDFQPKPFTSEELVNCIRRVFRIGLSTYQQIEAAETAKGQQTAAQPVASDEQTVLHTPVIAVYSPKGGVGTSAIAANLAVALHQAQGDVVLMDGDLQFGDILVHLNTRPNRTISDLIQQDQFEVDLLADVLMPHETGLKLLLAPPQPELADIISPSVIPEVINNLKKQFKMVVVDTHADLKETTLNILETADYILVVLTPELPSIKSAKLFLEVAEQLEYDPKRMVIVINQADKPGGIKTDKIEEVLQIDQTYRIPYDPKLHFALSKGQSICQQDSSAPSARAITAMAHQLWRTMTEGRPVEAVV